jgi:hypothetical protein
MRPRQPDLKHSVRSVVATLGLVFAAVWLAHGSGSRPTAIPLQSSAPPANQTSSQTNTPALPRGKKLFLKDGGFQLVREYSVAGDRVRYYSLDSSQWEEMPTALVDWDATKKAEADEAQRDAAIVAKVDSQEKARHAEMKLDTDASLEAAPGVFLPPGEGLFEFDGKAIFPLKQAATADNLSKKHLLEQVLVPIPIISTRHTVSIPGTRARLRLKTGQPEFYMRTADNREPEMELLRVHVHGDSRQVENLDELFGETHATRDSISMQRWAIAEGVSRFTLSQTLPPGEYAFAEIVQGQTTSLYVWDFGVDAGATTATSKPK